MTSTTPSSNTPTLRSRKRFIYVFVAATIITVTMLFALGTKHDSPDEEAQLGTAALAVTSTRPRAVIWPETLQASGGISAWEEASIGAQIGGYQLAEVRVNVGDTVKKGQVLARFDRALLLAEKAQLQANADQAAANRQRALGLKSSGGISDQDVLQFVTQSKAADAQLAYKQLELRYADVLAPDDGVISARSATLGSVVPVGQELFRMIRQGRLEWRGELTAAQLAKIQIGQEVALALPDGSSATALIRQTSPSLDEDTRLAIAYADIQPGSHARAGMYANGSVQLGDSPALVVPAESMVIRDGRSHALTLANSDSITSVSLREVVVGRRVGREVEVTTGLDSEEQVVVKGAGFLKDRDLVRVMPSGAAKQ